MLVALAGKKEGQATILDFTDASSFFVWEEFNGVETRGCGAICVHRMGLHCFRRFPLVFMEDTT